MQGTAPCQLVLGVFRSAERADAVRGALRESARRRLIAILALATIKRHPDGRVEVIEARHGTTSPDELPGSLPAMFRLMVGPTDDASTSTRLQAVAAGLEPDSSAIAALFEHRWVDDVRSLLEEAGADAVTDALRTEVSRALASGRDLVLTDRADWRTGG